VAKQPSIQSRSSENGKGHANTFEPRHAQAMTNRRRHNRILGPFEGIRVGALDTPVRIYDFSRGGCFVNAMHDQLSGSRLVLKIDLPGVGVITVTAEALDGRRDCGFPVRFVDVADETAVRLDQAFQHLQSVAHRSEHQALHGGALPDPATVSGRLGIACRDEYGGPNRDSVAETSTRVSATGITRLDDRDRLSSADRRRARSLN
jgi:hypothetical protein